MMKYLSMLALSLGMALAAPVYAADEAMPASPSQTGDQIYGYELMTVQERNEYRDHMRTLKTAQEREAYRLEHHKKMQERAKTLGKTLPDQPPANRGPGMGPGGGGMAPGGRMGPGGYGY